MQSPPDPAAESPHVTPFSAPLPAADDPLISPLTSTSSGDVDPLVAQASEKLDEVMNELRRQLLKRDGSRRGVDVQGSIDIAMRGGQPQEYRLSFTIDLEDQESPIAVRVAQKKDSPVTNGQSSTSHDVSTDILAFASKSVPGLYKPVRGASDKELEQEFVPSRKRMLEEEGLQGEPSKKRAKGDDEEEEDNEDIMPLITKADLDELLVRLRDDVQEDTAEAVNHLNKFLCNWKQQWHEKSAWDYEQSSQLIARQSAARFPGSVDDSASNGVRERAPSTAEAFPSPTPGAEVSSGSMVDLFRKEVKLLSSQVRWVEECRRVAADAHDKREETWRTTSAGFHDKNRQDRENFQNRIIHESAMHGRVLNQILNEVKALSNVTMSLKWETPGQQGMTAASPTYPAAPAPQVPSMAPPLPFPGSHPPAPARRKT